jgi:predicted SnoaL-like aldol condensation-catalyzing enzyme
MFGAAGGLRGRCDSTHASNAGPASVETSYLSTKERNAMFTELNKQLVLRWKEERNKGNVSVADDLCAPDIVLHMSGLPTPGPVRGREAFKQLFAAYLTAFEFHSMPEFLIAEGDMVAIHETYQLKHIGAFHGLPPTGKDITVAGAEIYRIMDGKFVEQWVEADMLSLLQQLGVLPRVGQGTA